jgi:hypothetical protein
VLGTAQDLDQATAKLTTIFALDNNKFDPNLFLMVINQTRGNLEYTRKQKQTLNSIQKHHETQLKKGFRP